jgi:membrane protease YdiL (CAAX protease family)
LYVAYLYHFTNGKFTILKPEVLMKGLLKSKSPGSQLLLVISIAMVSFFLISAIIGPLILGAITGISLKEFAEIAKGNFSNPNSITFIRGLNLLQFLGLFVIPCFICAHLFGTNSFKYLGLKKPGSNLYLIIGVAALIVAIPLVTFLGELNKSVQFPHGAVENWMKKSEAEAAKTIQALLSKHTIKDLILNIIFVALLAGVGEELFFRGMIQRLLTKMFKNPWPGIIIAAFLFSAMHMQFYGFFPRFALGILLGVMYWYSGSLWTAILAHFVYDALLITLIYFNPEMLKEDSAGLELNNIALAGTISFVMVVLLIELMRKKSTTRYDEVYADDKIPYKDHPF